MPAGLLGLLGVGLLGLKLLGLLSGLALGCSRACLVGDGLLV
jgi:hypothetical protein